MIICLGPVCVPVWGLLPLLAIFAGRCRDFLLRNGLWPSFFDYFFAQGSGPKAEAADGAPPGMVCKDGVCTLVRENKSDETLKTKAGSEGVRKRRKFKTSASDIPICVDSAEEFLALETAARREGLAFVVDFTASWCKPCKRIAPLYEKLCAKHRDCAIFVKVDVDVLQDLAMDRGAACLPTFHFYTNGLLAAKVMGASESELVSAAQSIFGKE